MQAANVHSFSLGQVKHPGPLSEGNQAPYWGSCPDGWTLHARARSRQRGIAQRTADLLLDWGGVEHLPGGVQRVSFRKRDLQRLQQALPKPDWLALEKQRKLYAVLDGGNVITIGHRQAHLKRK